MAMSAGFGTALPQNVAPNQPVIFTDNTCPCTQGLVFKKSGGVFLLASNAPTNGNSCTCGCRRIYLTNYEVEVHANIEIPTGGTVEEIRLAIAVDGIVDPDSIMSFVPAAVETPGNVGTSIIVPVPSLCGCESVAVVNVSAQDITVNNASIVFDYAGIRRVR
jgi:hypothetical protein